MKNIINDGLCKMCRTNKAKENGYCSKDCHFIDDHRYIGETFEEYHIRRKSYLLKKQQKQLI
jgi:hypothetical protein